MGDFFCRFSIWRVDIKVGLGLFNLGHNTSGLLVKRAFFKKLAFDFVFVGSELGKYCFFIGSFQDRFVLNNLIRREGREVSSNAFLFLLLLAGNGRFVNTLLGLTLAHRFEAQVKPITVVSPNCHVWLLFGGVFRGCAMHHSFYPWSGDLKQRFWGLCHFLG